jgi:tetratricopeptide (TPR) repeat protein
MKNKLTIWLLVITSQLFSQNNIIDSIQQRLIQTSGRERILILNDLAVEYWTVDLSKSLALAKEALDLEEELKYFKTKARTLNIIGVTYYRLMNYTLANDYYDQCLEIVKKYGTKDDEYKCLGNKIVLYTYGNIKDSINAQNIFKRYINMTIEKNSHFEFYQGLMSFLFVYHISKSKDSMLFEYTNQLLKINKI